MDDNNLNTTKTTEGIIKDVNISSEMKKSFLSYAMSVIVSRALPDIRDGLKPVQRRIIFGMKELGVYSNSQYKKSARIVGDVMGKYHPHGDSSIYDAMVRMAQSFNQRYILVDGHGNFGSVDGDPAAAMRYTEARMSKLAMELIRDIDKDTVDFQDNYDASETEPCLMPCRYPNLLVNGSTGIAVGMATNIPPHNLGEVIDGILAYMENRDIGILELMEYIKGPDFPTGAQILGLTGLRNAYQTGNGKIVIRSKVDIVNNKNRNTLVVTEIPYQVNKTRLIEKIAEIAKDKVVEGITDLRDESNRRGTRIVIELRRDVNPHVMLNNLYKHTQLQESYGLNMIALVNGEPKTITLKDAIVKYVDFQLEVVLRRTKYDLDKAEKRLHILEGLVKVLNDIDHAIELIKSSPNGEAAKERLILEYNFSDEQAKAILDMRLQRLTGLEIEKIKEEEADIRVKVVDLKDIIASDERKETIIKEELLEIKDKYADERRSEINLSEDLDIEDEELIPVEDVIVTVTSNGYIKRMNVDQYKSQHRGGVGFAGIKMHEDDFVEHIQLTSTHDFHLFFTDKGRVFKMKGYKIPIGSRQSKGIPIVNLLKLQDNEELASFTSIKDFDDENSHLFFVTKNGIVKKTNVSDYKNIRTNGIIALTLKDDDALINVSLTDGNREIIIGASHGKAIRFNEADVRSMGRTATGVRGMNLPQGEKVVGAAIVESEEQEILVVTENGFGKRTNVGEYRLQTRGGKGVKTLNVTDKNGKLTALKTVNNDEDLIVITDKGVVIRTSVAGISQTKRATQGVRIIKLKQDQKVSTVALVPHQEEEENLEESPNFTQEEIQIDETKKTNAIELEALEKEEESETITKKSMFDEE